MERKKSFLEADRRPEDWTIFHINACELVVRCLGIVPIVPEPSKSAPASH
jgi:hypothetical protein